MPTKAELQAQLQRLRASGLHDKLAKSAEAHGIEPAFLLAIASRETNCVNELGDLQNGEAHGVGILQVDIQHEAARQAREDGSWRTAPDSLIDFATQLLADNLRRA